MFSSIMTPKKLVKVTCSQLVLFRMIGMFISVYFKSGTMKYHEMRFRRINSEFIGRYNHIVNLAALHLIYGLFLQGLFPQERR